MSPLATRTTTRQALLRRVFATALAAIVGLQAAGLAAERVARLWTVMVHFEYDNGLEYDYVIGDGVTTDEMTSILQDCAVSHQVGSVVRYHCYAVPE